jgi:hypothetical protein
MVSRGRRRFEFPSRPCYCALVGPVSRYCRQVCGTVRQVVIEGRKASGELSRFVADYEYVFDGAPHRNCEFVGQTSTDRDEAANYARGYAAGEQIDVFVDPVNPERSTLDPRLKYRKFSSGASRGDIEAGMHRARHLVNVLAARALRPDRAELDLGWIDRYRHGAPCAPGRRDVASTPQRGKLD